MRGMPNFAAALRAAGFTVLNVANNHSMQHGRTAFEETTALLKSAGLECCGLRGSGSWNAKPVRVRRLGADLGLLGYSLRPTQPGAQEPLYAEGTREGILNDVSRLRAEMDNVIVSLHWGEEFVSVPSSKEVKLGHEIIEAGATAVVGHHPHVVRPVEQHGNGVIAYSLGNFIGDMVWYEPFRTGAVLRFELANGRVTSPQIIDTRLDSDYLPTPQRGGQRQILPTGHLTGLHEKAYATAIARTWRRQRMASYLHALLNAHRTPRAILGQLVCDTLRNKLAADSTFSKKDALSTEST